MAKIKYGILGCGKHALNTHASPCKDLSNLELKAICDISLDSLANFEKVYGEEIEKFTDRKKFFAYDIDAVLIGTPDEFHFQDLVEVIGAGKHAFAEKPLATKSTEMIGLKKVLDSASEKGLIISSCHLRRYDPPFIWLKENLPDFTKKFGSPIHFSFDFSYHKPSKNWKKERGRLGGKF